MSLPRQYGTKRNRPTAMSVCSGCGSDLTVRTLATTDREGAQVSDGFVYCSNAACRFSREPHPMSASVNKGATP